MGLVDAALDLLFPPKCPFCRRLTARGEGVCPDCLRTLPYTTAESHGRKLRNISRCVAPFYYKGRVRESLLRYKFGGLSVYSQIYAEFIAKCIDENGISCDIITWVPLSAKRFRSRGYDQARLIADALSRLTGIRCVRLLKKTRHNPAQSGTGSAEKRRANVSGVYSAMNTDEIAGKRILLVDDIVTTGSTLSECARVLAEHGSADVQAAAVARGCD